MPDEPVLQVRCHAALGSLQMALEFTAEAQATVLFGPSGSGKSSLLRLIAGLWSPAGSAVLLRGKNLSHTPPHRRHIALAEQRPALFPHLDVLGNVRFGCPNMAAAESMLNLFDLTELRHAGVRQLSGGEYQRVALARALASQPRLLLLDEVFTGMHRAQRDRLLRSLREHCAGVGLPMLAVTHDTLEACAMADDVIRLEDGKVLSQGRPHEILAHEREALRQALRD